jgi:integrase
MGKRRLRLRHKSNPELFHLYDSQLGLRHRSPEGLQEARRVLGHFQEYLGAFPPSPELAANFLAGFRSRKPTTLYRYNSIIKGFMEWLGEDHPIRVRDPETLPHYVEAGELDSLKAALANKRTHKGKVPRNLLLIETACLTGLRRAELANLKVADINLERQYLVVRQGKGQKDRLIDLVPSLADAFRLYLKGKPPEEKVFGLAPASIGDIVTRAARGAGVHLHAHSLRDHFATRLVDEGVDLEIVRQLLGHANLNVTRRYLARTDAQRRAAIHKLEKHDAPATVGPDEGHEISDLAGQALIGPSPKMRQTVRRRKGAPDLESLGQVRLRQHLDQLAHTAQILAHHVGRLLRYKADDNVSVLGNMVAGLSFWRKSSGQPLSETIDPLGEWEYEKEHPLDAYLASCLLAHYRHCFGPSPFQTWEEATLENVGPELLQNLMLLSHSEHLRFCPSCPSCQAIEEGFD